MCKGVGMLWVSRMSMAWTAKGNPDKPFEVGVWMFGKF